MVLIGNAIDGDLVIGCWKGGKRIQGRVPFERGGLPGAGRAEAPWRKLWTRFRRKVSWAVAKKIAA
jgi:hypothetical protein